ncbi:MAG: OmpA family protein, partial [Bacteroidota bacterium]
ERGFGKFDLYYSQKSEDGWSQPANLGSRVNSKGSDQWPFVQGDTLYFASSGHPGMGGLDIFRATWDTKKWNFVENLKAPLNSGADDFAYYLVETQTSVDTYQQTGYLSSNRPGGKGADDIYKYERTVLPPPIPVDTVEEPPIVFKLNLQGTVLGKLYADPSNPNSTITGREPLENAKIMITVDGEKIPLNTNSDGNFNMELEVGKQYDFLASKAEYLNNTAELSTEDVVLTEANPVQVLTVEITLDRLFTDVEIVLPNIYYDFDKADIRTDAEPTLNELTKILQNNPQIKIQLVSHTDCRGGDDYNKALSQRRADSAIQYLAEKGIPTSRLEAFGAGEDSPAIDCACQRCTDDERQANRRTSFKILE